jgi:amino acid adenylation domain-containing protein
VSDDLAARLRDLTPAQRALLERRLVAKRGAAARSEAITPRAVFTPCAMSYSQELLWLIDQLVSEGNAYNSPSAVRLEGPLDSDILEQAMRALVERHEILRTTYDVVDGVPVQVISRVPDVQLDHVDLSASGDEREERLLELMRSETERPFDLRLGPMFRPTLIRLAPEDHVLLIVQHHIATDGWSRGVLFGDLTELYDALVNGETPALDPLPLQYADYAVWHRAWLEGESLERQLEYWRQTLGGAPALLTLPTDRPRPAAREYTGDRRRLLLESRLVDDLRAVAREENATLFMGLLAAFAALLHRHAGQEDVVVGTPFVGRNRVELERVAGYFVNPLALRVNLSGDPTFRELLRRAREMTLGAFEHGHAPYELVVKAANPERDLSQTPLFQVMMVLHNPEWRGGRPKFEPAGVRSTELSLQRGWSKFDLLLSMSERHEGFNTSWEYSTELFADETVERLTHHFHRLLEAVVADPDIRVSAVPLLGEAERRQVVETWNATARRELDDNCLHALFEAAAARTPEATALVDGERELTYVEVDARANRLARSLRDAGADRDVPIGVFLERSAEFVVSALAVLKAGAACLPLDPDYPDDRLAYMTADSGARAIVTTSALAARLPDGSATVIELDRLDLDAADSAPPEVDVKPDDVAYVIYTSGSTGQPRGVELLHRGLANHALASIDLYDLTPDDRVLQFSSVSFDISVEEIFPTLAIGAAVVVRSADMPIAGREFLEWLERHRVTVLDVPTAFWHAWTADLAQLGARPESLRFVIVGGEKASAAVYDTWRAQVGDTIRWINTYGPTEASVVASAYEPVGERLAAGMPIGSPIANTRLYVLDGNDEPTPIGVPGELHIGGVGVARGYLGRPELTAEKFVADPFVGGVRMYRTGDVVRWLRDGTLEFVGRTDDQVKIRGFRIEPGEVEAALEQHPAVRAAVVVPREDTPGDRRLVAYVQAVVAAKVPGAAELRSALGETLPAYMLPSAIVFLDELPLTPNGKIDRDALPAPTGERDDVDRFVEPRSDQERVIAGIWSDVLGVDRVGAFDNFFALGGHSLLATQVVARLRDAMQAEVPIRTIFESPTVAQLAEALSGLSASTAPTLPQLTRVDRSQHRADGGANGAGSE